MSRLFSLILFTFICLSSFSQELTIKSFRENPSDLSARTNQRTDKNDNPCALIRVEVLLDDVKFQGNVIDDVEHKVNEYWVYMSEGSKHLKVRHHNYYSCDIVFADYGINSLAARTTYELVLVKVEQGNGNVQSNVVSQRQVPEIQDARAVDLGLSVKWASCNVGATRPEEYGYYFAWGETKTKTKYNTHTYKWCRGIFEKLTKYCIDSSSGKVDNKTTLDPEDDAAHVNWGGSWRMPTETEMDELRTKCIRTWTTQNGVKGCKVTGPNGNSIFIPAAGYRMKKDLWDTGSRVICWTSSLNISHQANFFNFFNLDTDQFYLGFCGWLFNRTMGFTVRPVCP